MPDHVGSGEPVVGVDVGVTVDSLMVVATPDGREIARVLAQQHQIIVVETLNASGMRSAGGASKKGLNRALADAALAEIGRMLGYKTRWYGSHLVEADRYYPSSKTCSGCGERKPSLTLADRIYRCEDCGLVIDRDHNAAINLARLGETHTLGEPSPAGSGSVAGRGAMQETATTQVVNAAGGHRWIEAKQTEHAHVCSPEGNGYFTLLDGAVKVLQTLISSLPIPCRAQ